MVGGSDRGNGDSDSGNGGDGGDGGKSGNGGGDGNVGGENDNNKRGGGRPFFKMIGHSDSVSGVSEKVMEV